MVRLSVAKICSGYLVLIVTTFASVHFLHQNIARHWDSVSSNSGRHVGMPLEVSSLSATKVLWIWDGQHNRSTAVCGDEPFHELPSPPRTVNQAFFGRGADDLAFSNQSNLAVCNIDWNRLGLHFDIHFPHTMETVFLCWSWWWMHPMQQKVLEVPPDFEGKIKKSSFNSGFFEWLRRDVIFTQQSTESMSRVQVIPRREARWFHTPPYDAQALRDSVVDYHFHGRNISGCNVRDESLVRIGILNRKKTRDIVNIVELVEALQVLVTTKIAVAYFEKASFKDQVDFFSSIDILVSPHGAQLTGVIFMPRCGAFLELFPKSYWIPNFFGDMALGAGLRYSYLYLATSDKVKDMEESQSKGFRFRARARAAHFHVPVARVVSEVSCMISQWSSCCTEKGH